MECLIERIEIVSFGKLKNVAVQPQSGLNLLCAPNESGKSTLASFLRFVLYGFADARKKELSENDKKRYTPWDSPKSEGSLTVRRGERRYRITRSCPAGGKETVSTVELSTGKEAFSGIEPGVALLGVSEEVFSRTLFFRQLSLPQSRDDVMAEQLQNLAVSSDEQVGSKKAQERLTKARNELKGRAGSGYIPRLEQECIRLEARLAQAKQEREQLEQLRETEEKQKELLSRNAVARERAEKEKSNLEKWDARQTLEQLERIRRESERAENVYRELTDRVPCRGEGDVSELTELTALRAEREKAHTRAEIASRALQNVKQEAAQTEEKPKRPAAYRLACIFAAVCGACGGVLLAVGIPYVGIGVLALGLLFGILFSVLLFRYGKQKRTWAERRRQEEEKRNAERAASEQALAQEQASEALLTDELCRRLAPYALEDDAELPQRLRERIKACQELINAHTAYESAARAYRIAAEGTDLAALQSRAEGALPPERERDAVEREWVFLRQQGELLAGKAAETAAALSRAEGASADPALLVGKLDATRRMLADCKKRYTAYELAREGIEQASDLMKATVAPRLAKQASVYFSAATDGKYRELRLDTRLAMTVREDGPERDGEYLSAGTRDAAYLSLRLALADLLFAGAGMPFVLDDAFGRLDDKRLACMLQVLAEAAKKQQILLFCCTEREKELLERAGLPYTALPALT